MFGWAFQGGIFWCDLLLVEGIWGGIHQKGFANAPQVYVRAKLLWDAFNAAGSVRHPIATLTMGHRVHKAHSTLRGHQLVGTRPI